jgi:hypothetical protein
VRPASEPFDFAAAVAASREASEAQHNAERWYAEKGREFADAERTYRQALAAEIVKCHAAGSAWTVAQDLARGTKEVADYRYARDVAEGLRDAAAQSIWRHTADRRELEQILDWSKRAAFLDALPPQGQPTTFGGKSA